jgi:hypothetical protein
MKGKIGRLLKRLCKLPREERIFLALQLAGLAALPAVLRGHTLTPILLAALHHRGELDTRRSQ